MNSFEQEEHRIEQKSVLIVDKDRKFADLLSNCFCSLGLTVWITADASEATSIMGHITPDLMILDVHTPTFDGDSYLQYLDLQETQWQIPAIVLCKSNDLNSGYRVENICAYYVHKSPKAWNRIEMFAKELVDLGSTPFDESTDENSSKSDIY